MERTTVELDKPYSQVAREVGISVAHLSYILSRKRKPSFPVAAKLARATGVSLDQLAESLEITA